MMKFEIDDTKMDEATKKKLVDCVCLLGLTVVKEPVEDKHSGFVDMRVVKPKAHEKFFYLYNNTVVGPSFWDIDYENDDYNNAMWSIGNVYNTKEQAEYALERMKVRAELERLSLESWGDNWYSFNSLFFDIKIGLGTGIPLLEVHASSFSIYSNITFATAGHAEEAIRTVGADRIKKYLFNVWV